jgi:regulator of cell morphogenesis and NO signaling
MQAIKDRATGRSWENPCDLLDYLLKTHHAYLRMMLPHLDRLAEEVVRERRVPPEYLDQFQREFTALADLLENHLAGAESWVFPHIRRLCEATSDFGWTCELDDGLGSALAQAARESQEAVERVRRLRECLGDVHWLDKGASVDLLIHNVEELADSLALHVHLENEVLYPRIEQLLGVRSGRAMAF